MRIGLALACVWFCATAAGAQPAGEGTALSLLGVDADTRGASRAATPVPDPSANGEPTVGVMQCNPYCGGKYEDRDAVSEFWQTRIWPHVPILGKPAPRAEAATWETAREFAHLVATDHRDVDVIGMEEVIAPDTQTRMQGFLKDATRRSWEFVFEKQGDPKNPTSGLAVFFDPARIQLVESLGTVDIETLDSGYAAKFMGVLLRHVASGRTFGMFCGKIVWEGAIVGGHAVTEAQRVVEVQRLKSWIDRVLATHPEAARVITMDQNSEPGTPTFSELAKDYESDGSKQATWNSRNRILGRSIMTKKLDFVWYAPPAGCSRGRGFVKPATPSEHFGSDHRAVCATVRLAP